MEKSLLFILFCCMGFVAKAQTIEEIKILDANEIVPVCMMLRQPIKMGPLSISD